MKQLIRNLAWFILLFNLVPRGLQASPWIDQSSAIFFPKELKAQISASQTFPVFWWNFFVVSPSSRTAPDWDQANLLCNKLKSIPRHEIFQVECNPDLSQFLPLVQAWVQDLVFRTPYPGDATLQKLMNQSLAEASLPGGDSRILEILRQDPLQTWQVLKSHAERRMPLHLEMNRGFFWDAKSGRIVIPIQFAFPPNETARTKAVLDSLGGSALLGANGSTLQNETQIKTDMHVVGLAGFLILAIFAMVLFRMEMVRLVPLFSGVFLGIGASTLITKWAFGSIHGLTLSFGAAIAGLAMDYAFQAALNFKSKTIWKSNFCGFSTTTIGLVVVMFSSVPLLRQMMFFSWVAMAISYVAFFLFFKFSRFAHRVSVDSANFVPRKNVLQVPATLILIASAFAGPLALKPLLDLRQFDYQTAEQKKLSTWLYETTQLRTPLFAVHSRADFPVMEQEKQFAETEHLSLENRAEYLPGNEVSLTHKASWANGWQKSSARLSPTERKFFAPFLAAFRPENASLPLAPIYANHLTSQTSPGQDWITLWLTQNDEEIAKIRTAFPNTESLSELVTIFPKMLSHELGLMVPISILLALLFHLIYYRKFSYATIALIPFFAGFGLIVLMSLCFQFQLTFISVIALILVFGFSLDYGIFATDACITRENRGMWTGISLAAASTVAGFLPLVFCRHPVLRDLGLTLFLGGIGTYLGAVWGIPHAVDAVHRKANAS